MKEKFAAREGEPSAPGEARPEAAPENSGREQPRQAETVFEELEVIEEPLEKLEILKEELPEEQEMEEFLPELELKKIQKLPREEKREKLAEFKEKLSYQKEGLALMQKELIGKIYADPEMPLKDLYDVIDNYQKKYGLNLAQRDIAKGILQKYEEKHEKVKQIRKEYLDDLELYEVLFDKKPKGKIEVIEGPMTLLFRCYDPEDYAQIHSQAFMQNRLLTAKDLEVANMSGGAMLDTSLVVGLEGTLIAENVSGVIPSEITRRHEERHAINHLFTKELNNPKLKANRELFEKTAAVPAEKLELERIAERYFRGIRESLAEERAKDEILAYLKTNEKPQLILRRLMLKKNEGGIYDYLQHWREDPLPSFPIADRNVDVIKEAAKNVFEEEYHNLLRRGVVAFSILTERLGYPTERAIALLIDEPLIKWPKIVRRMYIEVQKNESKS